MIKRFVLASVIGVALGTAAYFSVTSIIKATSKSSQTITDAALEPQDKEEREEPTKTADPSQPKMLDLTKEVVVLLQGPIRDNGLTVAAAIKKASREGKRIWLLIDSPGGSVVTGAQVVTAIETAGVEVNTVCMVLCASMAAIIHQYGTNRYMVDRSFLMFHEASGAVQGTVPQMVSQLLSMTRYINKMIMKIAQRAGLTFDQLNSTLAAELWLDAEDALSTKFSDGTVNVYFDEKTAINPSGNYSDQSRKNTKQILNVEY